MAIIDPALVRGAAVFARQVASETLTSVINSATDLASSAAPSEIPSTSAPPPSPTAASSSASTTETPANSGTNNPNGTQQNTGQSSPLLFFVALGFGVVFTNLWIIVGVKYCFRYNARNRQMRLNEDGEPINLENMPRPHRRRREKKLMTMEEVNEKFPMLKYKSWVAGRVHEGLPTQGGVSVPPSRANSVRSVDGVVPDLPPKERDSTDDRPATAVTAKDTTQDSTSADQLDRIPTAPDVQPATTTTQPATTLPKVTTRTSSFDDDDEDDHIDAALPPEMMNAPGDSCAICIDSLEDDDDVRGLTCGHAFHAVCLDPWLTSRRACCPLCKADYYVPKPRPQPGEGGDGTTGVIQVTLNENGRNRMPSRPQASWFGLRGNGRFFPSRNRNATATDAAAQNTTTADQPATQQNDTQQAQPVTQEVTTTEPRGGFFSRRTRQRQTDATPTQTNSTAPEVTTESSNSGGMLSSVTSRLPGFRSNQASQQQTQEQESAPSGTNTDAPATQPTPSQLEAGVRYS